MAMDMGGAGMSGMMTDIFKDMREDLWNERAYYERGRDRQNAVEDAKLANQRNIDNYRSRYVWTMQDMANAGLNPILAASQGVGGIPSATAAHQTSASFPKASGSKGGVSPGVASYAQAATAAQAMQQTELTNATIGKVQAETREIESRTNTERERPEHVRAEVSKLKQEVEHSIQSAKTLGATEIRENASADQLRQHIKNLEEEVPKIKATVDLLVSQKAQIDQSVRAQLPELMATLHRLEASARVYGLPQKEKESMVHTSPVLGTISAAIKALSPLLR